MTDWTREQYMKKECTHQEFYFQFGKHLIDVVKHRIGEERIKQSEDPHFNDIPLWEWDQLEGYVLASIGGYIRRLNGQVALSDIVCTLKSAARHIRGH